MKLTKANCAFALAGIYSADSDNEHVEENVKVIQQLINEHFDNPEITSISAYRILKYKIDELEKALDKACDYLEYSDHFDGTNYNEKLSDMTKEQWKEYLLNED